MWALAGNGFQQIFERDVPEAVQPNSELNLLGSQHPMSLDQFAAKVASAGKIFCQVLMDAYRFRATRTTL